MTATCWSGRAHAQCYDREGNRVFYRKILSHLLEGAPSLAGQGLDLGCGTGFSTELLVVEAPQVTWQGVDCSPEMLALARRKPRLAGVALHEARAESLPFADATFDVVVANFAWHWFGSSAGNEVRRVLRPGGWVLASVPLRRFSRLSGNRALARALLAARRRFHRQSSQGLRFEEVPRVLPGAWTVVRHALVVLPEQFADGAQLLAVLDGRGALTAIFGDEVPPRIDTVEPVDFEWPFAVLHARR
jgi:SAM-dependent methyltransferase